MHQGPCLWQDDDGNFHALGHTLAFQKSSGATVKGFVVHAFSPDGLEWFAGEAAATNRVDFTDGTQILLNRRERPQIVLAENSRTIVGLSTSAEVGHSYKDRAFTLVQLIDTA